MLHSDKAISVTGYSAFGMATDKELHLREEGRRQERLVEHLKIAAAESLDRLNSAMHGHALADLSHSHLIEAHQRDREALFAAMRRLDELWNGP